METVQIGVSESGLPVRIDRNAAQADGIVAIGRIKAHTSFHGKIESGLMKMITIGLGKQYGAEICHEQGFGMMERNILSIARFAISTGKILFGVGLVENAYSQTMIIFSIPAEKIEEEEPLLLLEAKSSEASLQVKTLDVLIVDEIGKNISGEGMDPNATGRWSTPYASGGPAIQRMAVLNITEESHGNPLGAPVPTIKISSNTALYRRKKHWIDFDAGALITGASMQGLAKTLYECMLSVAQMDCKTLNEINGYRDIAMLKDGVTT